MATQDSNSTKYGPWSSLHDRASWKELSYSLRTCFENLFCSYEIERGGWNTAHNKEGKKRERSERSGRRGEISVVKPTERFWLGFRERERASELRVLSADQLASRWEIWCAPSFSPVLFRVEEDSQRRERLATRVRITIWSSSLPSPSASAIRQVIRQIVSTRLNIRLDSFYQVGSL